LDSDLSGPRDACGVFGVYAPGQPVSNLTYLGLYALQHRGQESAGIAASDGETITVIKDMGLVAQVFDEQRLGDRIHGVLRHTPVRELGRKVVRQTPLPGDAPLARRVVVPPDGVRIGGDQALAQRPDLDEHLAHRQCCDEPP
jgi:glutamine phosphoribosylpyrophosphate amidotransferase